MCVSTVGKRVLKCGGRAAAYKFDWRMMMEREERGKREAHQKNKQRDP